MQAIEQNNNPFPTPIMYAIATNRELPITLRYEALHTYAMFTFIRMTTDKETQFRIFPPITPTMDMIDALILGNLSTKKETAAVSSVLTYLSNIRGHATTPFKTFLVEMEHNVGLSIMEVLHQPGLSDSDKELLLRIMPLRFSKHGRRQPFNAGPPVTPQFHRASL